MSNYIYTFVLIICVLVGFYHQNALNKPVRYIFWLVCITLLVESIGLYNLKVAHKSVEWLYDSFLFVEYALMALYFRDIIVSVPTKKAITVSVPILFSWILVSFIFSREMFLWTSISFLLVAFLLCIYSCIYLRQMLQVHIEDHLSQNPHFWISTGILFFYAGTFFQSGLHKYLATVDRETANQLYMIINHMLNIILYSLFTYGFICKAKYQKLPS